MAAHFFEIIPDVLLFVDCLGFHFLIMAVLIALLPGDSSFSVHLVRVAVVVLLHRGGAGKTSMLHSV